LWNLELGELRNLSLAQAGGQSGTRDGDGHRPRELRPARFLVDEALSVRGIVSASLHCYAREGRMPLLVVYNGNFFLYTTNVKSDGMFRSSTIIIH
jgi:hypothetical protein